MAGQFRQIKGSLAEQFGQIKRSLAEQFRQIKCSLAEPHVEISFWFGKGDIPNEKIWLLFYRFTSESGVVAALTVQGWLVKNKMKGGVYNKPPYSRPPPLTH